MTSSECQFSQPFHVKWLRSRRCHAVRKRKDEEGESDDDGGAPSYRLPLVARVPDPG